MEWQQIIGFYNLVKQGNFTRAADASFRTQSALSQQIKKLEDEFQCQLINRISRKRFALTPAGERLFRFSQVVLGEYEKLSDDLAEIRGLPRGRLTIAAPFTTLYHLFPEQFRAFLKTYPHIELTILDRPQTLALALLRDGDIDVAIALESLVPKGLDGRRWKEVGTVLIVPDKHPLLKAGEITLSDIARYPLIMPPEGRDSRNPIRGRLEKEGIPYRVIMESGNVELSARYVEAGIGISFATVAKGLSPQRGRNIRFLPLKKHFKTDYLSVVSRKGGALQRYTEEFIDRILHA